MSTTQKTLIPASEIEAVKAKLAKKNVPEDVINAAVKGILTQFKVERPAKVIAPTTARGIKNQLTRLVKKHENVNITPVIDEKERTVSFILSQNELFNAEAKNLLEKNTFKFVFPAQ